MLEEKLDKLTIAVEALTLAITEMNTQIAQPVKMTITNAPKPNTITKTPSEAQGEAIEPPPLSAHGAEIVLLENLHAICLEIVRKNKADKDKIKAALRKYGGELLKDIKQENYVALKADLVRI